MIDKSINIEDVRELLLKRKREIEEKLIEMSQEKITDDQVQDPGDQALSLSMEALRTSLQNAELEQYQRISRALEKVEDGSYGVCMDCGTIISEKRLRSYPDAARCLSCQEKFEDRNGR